MCKRSFKRIVSSWLQLLLGVSQGSVQRSLLFNIYVNDLFYLAEMSDACNYAVDATFHACDMNLKSLIARLEHDAAFAIECHFPFSGHIYETFV